MLMWLRSLFTSVTHFAVENTVDGDNEIDTAEFIPDRIRNFGIVAHIDHGKSTLSDRLLEYTGTIANTGSNQQVLDKLPVERERGITVKAQTASMVWIYKGDTYLLNLIDTPGHVDFNYEVQRSLSACDGVILLVDANQGVQAQTVANFNLAFCANLAIIPVLNKIDLKNADVEGTCTQIENLFDIPKNDVLKVSAKQGIGIFELLEAIILRLPKPRGNREAAFRGFILDSWYDRYRGVILMVMVVDGRLGVGDEIVLHSSPDTKYTVRDVGIMSPEEVSKTMLYAGQTGYLVANLRSAADANVGDTISLWGSTIEILPTIARSKPMVFAGVYPADQSKNVELRSAIDRLVLNDPSVSVTKESSPALGQGFGLGFLGLLHMDVFCQRLDQEFDAQVIVTAPSVLYKVRIVGAKNIKQYGGEIIEVNNALQMPDQSIIKEYFEPMAIGTIITPQTYFSQVMSLCMSRRGESKSTTNIDNNTIMMQYKFPLSEIIVDFYDALKSISSGYASFDYEEAGYEKAELVKLTILLNGRPIDELTTMVHLTRARQIGLSICTRLKEEIPQQSYAVALQAAVGSKIVARENLPALRKNVTQKVKSGHDMSRKKKLLREYAEKQTKLRMIGNIEVPRDAFIKVLKQK